MATVDAMKIANKEMKKQYKGIDIDKIEVSIGLASHSHQQREFSKLMSRASTTTWKT